MYFAGEVHVLTVRLVHVSVHESVSLSDCI